MIQCCCSRLTSVSRAGTSAGLLMDQASGLTKHVVHHEHEACLPLWPPNSPACCTTAQIHALNAFPPPASLGAGFVVFKVAFCS